MKDYKLSNFLLLLDRRGCFLYGLILSSAFLYSSAGISALYGDSQWLIEKGDSVYSIARQVFPDDASKQRQFRQEVVKANPTVFNGNANHMGVGQQLVLPGFVVSKPAPVVTPAVVVAPVVKQVPEVEIVESEPVIKVPEVAEEQVVAPDPEEVIGQVVISVGNMQANNRGSFRKLLRHSEILKGDTLTTSKRAYTQIRMKDGALISLRPNTQLKIIDYHFNGSEDGSERSVMELVSGGFRTITGFIGHVNKQNYRVKTSVATIGIRGTHYGLMVCADGSCNEESASLEDGVYGGVVDGSIVVENDAGKFTFNNDQYFHVASLGQVAVEQLVPPPIFHGKSEKLAAREGADRDSDVADNGKNEEGQQKSGNSTETRKFKAAANDAGDKNRRVSRLEVPGGILGPIVRDSKPDVVPLLPPDRDKENTIAVIIDGDTTNNPVLPTSPFPKVPAGTDITLAPNGSGMLIAITDIDPQTGIENTGTATIVVAATTNNAIGLTTANVGAAVISNLPVVVHEESAGQVHDLLLPSGAAGIADTGGNAIGVNWGRWAPGFELTEDGLPLGSVGALHYIYSDKLTSPTQLAALGGLMSIASYTKAGGTIPTNAAGQQGSLQSLNVTSDFINGSITYDLSVQGAGGTLFDMQGVDSTGAIGIAFGEMNEFQLNPNPISPSCTSCVGNASAAFVGSQAEGIITTYSVQDSTGDGVNGAELLTRP